MWSYDGNLVAVFESTTGEALSGMSVSHDGRYAVVLSVSGNLTVYDLALRESVFDSSLVTRYFSSLELVGFAPKSYSFGLIDAASESLTLYSLGDQDEKLPGSGHTIRYRNAKIVLVGDSGVGKSGLALALTGKPFAATESTHARTVWSLGAQEIRNSTNDAVETHELMLWDLAGQPGYRSFHKLSLRDVAVGLVVFDAR